MTDPTPAADHVRVVREALAKAREFIATEYRDPAAEVEGEWLAHEARPAHAALCSVLPALDAIEADLKWRTGERAEWVKTTEATVRRARQAEAALRKSEERAAALGTELVAERELRRSLSAQLDEAELHPQRGVDQR